MDPAPDRPTSRLGPRRKSLARLPAAVLLAAPLMAAACVDGSPPTEPATDRSASAEPAAQELPAGVNGDLVDSEKCFVETFEDDCHRCDPVPPPGSGMSFSGNLFAAARPPETFANNPSGTKVAAWGRHKSDVSRGIADVQFDPPVARVSFYFSVAVQPLDVEALDADGAGLASDTRLPNTKFFDVWDPLELEVGANDIATLRLTAFAGFAGIDDLSFCRQVVIPVEIDVKPGDEPNAVNPKSRGLLPVAILSTQTAAGEGVDFDAADADPSTITLGDGAAPDAPVAERGNGSLMTALEDVDSDGDLDLVLHFETHALVANGDLSPAAEELVLTGETGEGMPIRGVDEVTVMDEGGPP